MELLFANYPLSNQMLKVAKEDLALVFVAPIDEQLMLHCIYRICNSSTEFFSVSVLEFKSSPSIIQLSSSKSSDLFDICSSTNTNCDSGLPLLHSLSSNLHKYSFIILSLSSCGQKTSINCFCQHEWCSSLLCYVV